MTLLPIPHTQSEPVSATKIRTESPILYKEKPVHRKSQSTHESISPVDKSLFQRQVTGDEPFTPSDFLQPFFQDKGPLTLADAAKIICQYIADLAFMPLESVTKTLSNSGYQTDKAFFTHCVQFLESVKNLPEKDPNIDNKIMRSYEAYQNCLSLIERLQKDHLQFFMTDLTIVPPALGQRVSLTKLNLWYNHLTFLPESIGALINLTVLSFTINHFTQFPAMILRLQNLTTLSFNKNEIEKLPDNFGDLRCLQSLDCSENKLTSLPDSFCQLTKLRRLSINENKLESLPAQFGNLINLEVISLFKNKLTILPESFVQLESLEYLDLSYNVLVLLPEGMYQLTQLQSLSLNGNYLMEFDPRILELPALEMLLLYGYSLVSQLDFAIRQLKNFGDVFTEKHCQPPMPFDEENHISYFESVD
jgi:hypothetical protein